MRQNYLGYTLFVLLQIAGCFSCNNIANATSSKEIDLKNPYLVAPTPEAASLLKHGQYSVSPSTGIPNISIPIFTIQTRNFSIPIDLSYYAGGIKIDDKASWVGLGWSLNVGGVINRTIQDQPDDRSGTTYIPSSGILKTSADIPWGNTQGTGKGWQHLLRSISNIVNSEAGSSVMYHNEVDKMKDRYDYAFSGISGSFFIDNGQVQQFPNTDNKIILLCPGVINGGFKIITPDGTSYYFTKTETTTITSKCQYWNNEAGLSDSGVMPYSGITAWYLEKIISFNKNDSINFSYENYHFNPSIDYSLSQSYAITYEENPVQNYTLGSTITSRQQHNHQILKEISFCHGKIKFNNLKDRTDIQMQRLTSLEINGKDIYKRVNFENNDYFHQKRLKLNSISFLGHDGNQIYDSYTFDYNIEHEMPAYFNGSTPVTDSPYYSQDLCGYYNGKINPGLIHFLPSNHPYISLGDRSFSFDYAKTYTLKKIKYNTGGETEFIYDSYPGSTSRAPALRIKEIISKTNISQSTPAEHKTYNYLSAIYKYGQLFSNSEAFSEISYNNFYEIPFLTEDQSPENTIRPPIPHGSMSNTYYSNSHIENYALTMHCKYNIVEEYQKGSIPNGDIKTRYTYEIDDPIYEYTKGQSGRLNGVMTKPFFDNVWNTISIYCRHPLSSYFAGIYKPENLIPGNFSGYLIDVGWKNSLLKEKTSYKLKDGVYVPIEKVINGYQYYKLNDKVRIGTYTKGLIAFSIMPKYNLQTQSPGPLNHTFDWLYLTTPSIDDYYFFDYYVSSGWKKLVSTKLESYSENGTISREELFEYNFIEHARNPHSNLTVHTLITSNNENKVYNYRYPADECPNNTIFQNMIDGNCINEVIAKVEYLGLKTLTSDNISYRKEIINGKELILPDAISHKLFTYDEDGVDNTYTIEEYQDKFEKYDKNVNLLEIIKSDNTIESYYYIPEYSLYPIIHAVNLTYVQLNNAINSITVPSTGLPLPESFDIVGEITADDIESVIAGIKNMYPSILNKSLGYTYVPLVGMTSSTDPNGITTYYKYDSFGRLQNVKDHEGNILKQTQYHYQNQP